MTMFATILEKLGLLTVAAPSPAGSPPSTPKSPLTTGMTPQTLIKSDTAAPVATPPRPPMTRTVDVVTLLNKLSTEKPGLDWKTSIVDLLKLLGIDSTLNARKELAIELGCPPGLMTGDYAKMNVWLQKTILQKIAENGGNIPKELLN